MIFFPS